MLLLLTAIELSLCGSSPYISTDKTNKGNGKGKVFPLQAGDAQRVGRVIALLFHDCGTRRG